MMKDNTESGDNGDNNPEEMGNIYISSEQIIQEVQKFRCLYDPADPDHKDRDVVRDAWLSVTQAVVGEPWASMNTAEKDEAVKEFRRKWRNIKDAMRKSLLHGNLPASSFGTRKRPYHFFHKLTFLLETESFKSITDPRSRKSPASSKKKGHTTQPIIHVMKKDISIERGSSNTSPHEACQTNKGKIF